MTVKCDIEIAVGDDWIILLQTGMPSEHKKYLQFWPWLASFSKLRKMWVEAIVVTCVSNTNGQKLALVLEFVDERLVSTPPDQQYSLNLPKTSMRELRCWQNSRRRCRCWRAAG